MSSIRGDQVARLADAAIQNYAREGDRLREAGEDLVGAQQALRPKLDQAWDQLTVTLVPGLVAEHLDWVAGLIHLPAITAAQVHGRVAADRESLRAKLEAVEASPDFVEREARLNACEIEIAELERPLAPLRASLILAEAEPLFHQLIASGYDTDSYAHKFWELAYYRHWKHGDRVVESYGEPRGLKRFAEIRARYLQELEACRTLEPELARVVARRAEIEALVLRQLELAAALDNIEDRHWAQTRARVRDHLEALLDDLVELLSSYEPGLYAAKRVLGMLAKQRYLEAMRETWIDEPLRQVERKLSKAQRGAVKYRRSKHAHRSFSADEMRRKYAAPQAGWDKRWARWEAAYPRVVAYERYDEFDLHGDSIWWHEMTGGSVKARFIPEVGDYYSRRKHGDARDDAVAALAQDARASGGAGGREDGSWDDYS